MEKSELAEHKRYPKKINDVPAFKPIKSQKLPPPLHKIKSSRVFSTSMLAVSDKHLAVLYWKDGDLLSDTSFYGYLFLKCAGSDIYPLLEYHWHPSHKGHHVKTPCRSPLNYTNRGLPMAIELNVSADVSLDPRTADGRSRLLFEFCSACGITLAKKDQSDDQASLWS
jgi:hypothetical protein